MSLVTVIDYKIGNLTSVVRALKYVGADVVVSGDPNQVRASDKIVLPGVGAFADGMAELRRLNLVEVLREHIMSHKSFLGICVGMQLMFDIGQEFGTHEGLGVIPGKVVMISKTTLEGLPHKIPHIGWGQLVCPRDQTWNETLLEGCQKKDSVYFLHSFVGQPKNKENLLAQVDYNGRLLTAAVKIKNAYGFQFHLEKSGAVGLSLLKKFVQ